MSCVIRFEKDSLRKLVHLSHGGKNLYKLEQFAAWAGGYSLAEINKLSATQVKTLSGSTREGNYGSVELWAVVKMIDEDGKPYWFNLPAPDASIFDTHQEVTPEFGIECAAKYSILAGQTLTFTEGALGGVNT